MYEIKTEEDARQCYKDLCNLIEFSCTKGTYISCFDCDFTNKGDCKRLRISKILNHHTSDKPVNSVDEYHIVYYTIREMVKTGCKWCDCENCCMFDKTAKTTIKCMRIRIRKLIRGDL